MADIQQVSTNKRKRQADEQDEEGFDEDTPACQSCRKRKAKCSRQQPCRQCTRLRVNCVYDERRLRPGIRTGAIEALNQRVSAVEQMLLGQAFLLKPLLATGVQDDRAESFTERVAAMKQILIDATHRESRGEASRPSTMLPRAGAFQHTPELKAETDLPANMSHLIDLYFEQVHRWIPVLHIESFKERARSLSTQPKLVTVLHAISSICLRLDDSNPWSDPAATHARCQRHRNFAMLCSMENFSVENLQALVIIAFDTGDRLEVEGGHRHVEQLQLSVEDEMDEGEKQMTRKPLMSRTAFLPRPKTWIEEEERRRVFWTVFLMDCFCSIATGWNNSLTDVDVRRRLPCEGRLWASGKPVRTPYFGIAARSSAAAVGSQMSLPNSERFYTLEEEVDCIGGFAFCIEAVENLNLITIYLLPKAISQLPGYARGSIVAAKV
ncbi:hypothetical protein M433DRAFT_133513 [Acidomyces richmondensis BFW]|nr:hypothetical protein M433DRAFT_133513 [Acidomyces richmondensis BFW]